MIIKTELLSGAGNTFHIIYGKSESIIKLNPQKNLMSDIARQICNRVPADGFIFLEKKVKSETHSIDVNEYGWYFYNNDGSEAEMCGNASRCVGFFIENFLKTGLSKWFLQTTAGPIEISKEINSLYKVVMSPLKLFTSQLGFYCDTGVPHLVLEDHSNNLFSCLNEELKQKSQLLRFDKSFAPKGTNVTYVQFEDAKNRLKAVTYERGVEDFTKACGTGAMAAAYFNLAQRQQVETLVEMPGGVLRMNLENLNRPTMTGPAILLGSYENEIQL